MKECLDKSGLQYFYEKLCKIFLRRDQQAVFVLTSQGIEEALGYTPVSNRLYSTDIDNIKKNIIQFNNDLKKVTSVTNSTGITIDTLKAEIAQWADQIDIVNGEITNVTRTLSAQSGKIQDIANKYYQLGDRVTVAENTIDVNSEYIKSVVSQVRENRESIVKIKQQIEQNQTGLDISAEIKKGTDKVKAEIMSTVFEDPNDPTRLNSRIKIETSGAQVDGGTIDISNNSAITALNTKIDSKLSKTEQDEAQQLITFLEGIKTTNIENDGDNITHGLTTLYNAISSHGFKNSMTAGSGWQIDNDGNAQVNSIEVRSYMRVLELVKNRLSAEESDFIFTESGTVETATPNEDGTYTLVMRKKTDKDITAFQVDDVLKGVVNDLAEPGAVGVKYYTSWVQVKEVNQTDNSIKVAVYADNDTPAKKNFPPCNLMVLHRWGNTTKEERQSCWYISSTEKRIVMLDGVTQPKLTEENYASFYGLPFEMENFKGYDLNPDQPYLYVRGAFLQDVCYIDYKGQIVKQERYRGIWSQEVAISNDPYIVTKTSFDTVYHNGAKWQCNSTTATTVEPSDGTTDWSKLSEGLAGSDGKNAAKAYVISNDIAIPTDANGVVTENFQIYNTFSLMVDGVKCKDLKVAMEGSYSDAPFTVNLNQLSLTISSSKGTNFGSKAWTIGFVVTGVLGDVTYSDIVTILVRPNKAGKDGKNLTKVLNFYKWGTSGSVAPIGDYKQDAIPKHVDGIDYLWNYEECYSNNDLISRSEKTCIGNFSRGIDYITEYYQAGTETMPDVSIRFDSNGLVLGDWKSTMPTLTNENRYLWNQEVVKFTDGTYSISAIHLAGSLGEKGDKGDQGDKGDKGNNAPRVLYFNSDTRPTKPTGKNPSDWSSIPLRPVTVSNMRAQKTSRAEYSFDKITNATGKEYWASSNKGVYNSIAEALIYFDTNDDGTVCFDWYVACNSADKATIYKVNSQTDTVIYNVNKWSSGTYNATVKKGTNFIRVCYEKGGSSTDEDRLFIRVLGTSTSRRIWVVTEILTPDGEYAGWSDPVQWTGNDGERGIQGPKGDDGKNSYFHIKYSPVNNPTSSQMTETPSTYIGTYVDNIELDSTDPGRYTWHRFEGLQGPKGEQGIPGKDGDGRTAYLHIKYSNDGGQTFTSNNGEDVGEWMGVYTDYNENDPKDPSIYTWSKIKGDKGEDAKFLSLKCNRPIINCDESSSPIDDGNITIEAVLENLSGTVTWSIDWDNANGEEIDTARYEIRGTVLEITDTAYFTGSCRNIYITATVGQYVAKTTIVVVNDGTNGKDGKPIVGPIEWKAGVTYLSGKSGEAYQHLVINPKYKNQMYLCGYTTSLEPSGQTSVARIESCTLNKPWVQTAYQDFVATKVLFANRGKIDNLDITNATIQGTVTDIAVANKDEWDKITDKCYKTTDNEYYFGKNNEDGRRFQIVVPDKAGSYFIPTINKYGNSNLTVTKIVFLPAIHDVSVKAKLCKSRTYDEYVVPAYKKAGTHINITMGASYQQCSRWAYLSDDGYKRRWQEKTSGKLNKINRDTICNIYNQGVLICADPLIFRSGQNDGHTITGGNFYSTSQSEYIHGRFGLNGASSRMIYLMPGQTLQLVSQIEKYEDGNECLVWNVVNASEFSAIKMNLRFSTETKSDSSGDFKYTPIVFPGSQTDVLVYDHTGSDDTWCDDIFAHAKLDIKKYNDTATEPPFLHFYRSTPDSHSSDKYPDINFERDTRNEQ